jgi:hypothetical protein
MDFESQMSNDDGPKMPPEYIPIGLFNPAPEKEDPIFYQCSTAEDGKTLTVGPFDLTAAQIKQFINDVTLEQLDELVNVRQLRQSTAITAKSAQMQTVIGLLESGQKPDEAMVERFIPGDLQRVIASTYMNRR